MNARATRKAEALPHGWLPAAPWGGSDAGYKAVPAHVPTVKHTHAGANPRFPCDFAAPCRARLCRAGVSPAAWPPSHLRARGRLATPNGCSPPRILPTCCSVSGAAPRSPPSCAGCFFIPCRNLVYLIFLFLCIKNRWLSLSESPNLPLFSFFFFFSLPTLKLLPVTLALVPSVPFGAVPRTACWQHFNLRSRKVGATASQEQLM